MTVIPRPEHPKPQFHRERWMSLNGTWRFGFDFGLSGLERGWAQDPEAHLDREILVPFCPESEASGIGHTDFINCCWYERGFELPANWRGHRVFLHFGAVDFEAMVWVNGELVGRHYGGGASFEFDITDQLQAGANRLVVRAYDDLRSGEQPSGKQSPLYASHACFYTRVTGIWQSVWLEARPESHIHSVRILPDLDGGRFLVVPRYCRPRGGQRLRVSCLAEGVPVAEVLAPTSAAGLPLSLDLKDVARPWSPEDPFLYELKLELFEPDGSVGDTVWSYAGLRKIHLEGNRIFLNNEPIFLRLVLDQGFYPEGVWTAPTDEALRRDIELSQALGFNGARLHQKVFEERFHYWADRLGYLTWGEYYDWGRNDYARAEGRYNMHVEWREVMLRDINHPSIVAWTPTNETLIPANRDLEVHRRVVQDLVHETRDLDPTRPVNDASGFVHVDTDIYTLHTYEQNPEVFREHHAGLRPDRADGFVNWQGEKSVPYAGQPLVVDEYGGTWWSEEEAARRSDNDQRESWGYGERPTDIEEVYHRIEGLTRVLTDHPHISGFTYTQLTDVEQEQNGLYTYDRRLKFDAERLRAIFSAPAAIEAGAEREAQEHKEKDLVG